MSSKTTKILTRRTVFLFLGLSLANVASYLFYFIMARMLAVEDYSLLYSLIALTYLFTIPHETIRTVIARYTMRFWTRKKKGKIKSLFFKSVKYLGLCSIIAFGVFLGLSPFLMKLLHAPFSSIIIIGFSLLFIFLLPVIWGILQGTNRFGHLGINNSVETGAKLIIAIPLVLFGLGVNGALLAIPLSLAIAFFAGFLPIKNIIKIKNEEEKHNKEYEEKLKIKGMFRYSFATFIIFIFFVAIYSVDIILARYFLTPLSSGLYSGASVIGKALLFCSLAITRIMFSAIVEHHTKNKTNKKEMKKIKTERTKRETKEAKKIFKGTVYAVMGFVAGFLLISILIPEPFINVLLGSKYLEMAYLLKYMVLAMAFLSFSSLIVFYNLSIDWHKKLTARILGAALFLLIALLIIFHSTLKQFIFIVLLVNILLFLALFTTLKH